MTRGVGEIGNITPVSLDYQQVRIFILQQLGYLPAENAVGNVCA